MLNSIKSATLSGLSVGITPPAAQTGSLTTGEANSGTITIPAGALWAIIENAGMVAAGDVNGAITVNGGTWTPGRKETFYSLLDSPNEEFFALPEITIVTTGSRVRYSYFG